MKIIASLSVLWFLSAANALLAVDTAPAAKPTLETVRYERTGGFAGTKDVIEITPDGAVSVQGRLMRNVKGQLSPEQIAQLITIFADWKKLDPDYPAPSGTADAFQFTIRYGSTTVSGSELNAQLPASFKAARSAIEKIAGELSKK